MWKRHPWLTGPIGIALLVTLLFFASFFIEVVRYICEKNEYTGQKQCAAHHLGPYALFWVIAVIDQHNGFVTALGTVAVAAFTWTLWRTSDKQSRLTRESIDEAVASSERQLRPYVHVKDSEHRISLQTRPDGTQYVEGIVFWFVWQNAGQTPAERVRTSINDGAVPMNQIGDPAFAMGNESSESAIGPGMTATTGLKLIDIAPLSAVWAGALRLYVWARIEYVDALRPTRVRHTQIQCRVYLLKDPTAIPDTKEMSHVRLRIEGAYNSSD